MVRIGSRGVFVPVSRHFLWVPNTHQPKQGVQGAKPPWRGLGSPQALPFTPLAACGGEEKRFLGTPQTPSKGCKPFAILLSSVRLMHIGHRLWVPWAGGDRGAKMSVLCTCTVSMLEC